MRKTLLAMTTALLAGAVTLFAAPGKLAENRPELPLKAYVSIPGGPTLRIQSDAADEAVASVPGITRLCEPAASAAAVRRTDEAEPQWGEWRYYLSGEISLDKTIYENLFGEGTLPSRIDVERRDDLNNPMRAQLKFVRLFGDIDLIMDYDIEAGTVDWEPVDLGRRFPGDDYGYDVVFDHAHIAAYFHPKRTLTTNVWFLVSPGLGYNLHFMFTPDTKPVVTFDVRFEQENVNSDRATVTVPMAGGATAKIKYTINDNPLGYSFDINGESISFMDILDSDYPGFDIRSVTPVQAPTWSEEVNLTGRGPYYLHFGVYDADGDRIVYGTVKLFPALPETDKWHSIGTGTFTDYTVHEFLQLETYYDRTLPEWWDTTSWNVEIEESNTTPGLYRVVNPFGAGCPFSDFSYSFSTQSDFTYSKEIKFDREHNYYMVIHAENPAFVWTEETLMGFTTHTTTVQNGQAYDEGIINHTYTWRHGYEASHYLDSPPHTSSVLSFKDQRIMSTLYNEDNFSLTLPGFISYDFNISTGNNVINFDFTGEGTSRVDYVVADFGTVDEAALLEALRNGTFESAHTISASGQVSNEELGIEYGHRCRLLAVSFDSNGQAHEERTLTFSFQERTYNYYGEATFNEPLWGNRYLVELYQSPDTPGDIFYVHNPYGVFDEFNQSHDRYMAVDCTDPERVRIEPFNIGIDLGTGPVIIATPEYAYRDLGYSEDEIVNAAPFGRFAYGEIDFGPGIAAIVPFIYDDPAKVTWGIYGRGSIEGVPGYRDPRFSLRQTEDGGIELYDFRKDTGTIAYTIVDASEISETEFQYHLSNPEILNSYEIIYTTEEGPLDLSKWNIEPLHTYIAGAVGLWPGDNSSPEYLTILKFTSLPETEYLTQADVTETIFAAAFSDIDVVTVEAPVYTSAQYPGCLLLKDLYKGHTVIGEYITTKTPIYTVIDCTDPQKVYIRDCDTGYPYTSSSNLFMMSRPALSSFDPAANPEFYGTFDGCTVSIPAGSAVLRFDNNYVPVNNEEFVVRLHNDISGVTDITAEAPADAPAEYFDILGRRVLRPSSGSLYIVRRGNAVTKEIR